MPKQRGFETPISLWLNHLDSPMHTAVYQKFIIGVFLPSLPSLSFFTFTSLPSLSPLFLPPRSRPLNSAKGVEGALLLPQRGKESICNHQPRSLGSKYTKNASAAEPR